MSAPLRLAFDRSLRSRDPFGRMKVEWTNVSKANVCPYLGREIPGYQQLGLDAGKVYNLWRHPDELKKAAATWDMIPVLDEHIVVDAANPEKDLIAGTTGTGSKFEYPYLKTPMAVWVGDSIGGIVQRKKRQLSSGYGYRPDMTPGVTPDGVAYDGVMRDIMANHVAIVREGRAGPDVMVADEQPPELLTMAHKRASVLAAVLAALAPALPAAITVTPEVQTAMDEALDAAILAAVDEAMKKSKGAKEHGEACDCGAKGCGKVAKDSDAGKSDGAGKVDPSTGRKPEDGAPNPAAAKDGAITVDTVTKEQATQLAKDAADAAVKLALDAERALVAARDDVAEVCGKIALDTAEKVYRQALKQENVAGHETIHASALPAVWAMHKASKVARASAHGHAQDSVTYGADASAAVASIGL